MPTGEHTGRKLAILCEAVPSLTEGFILTQARALAAEGWNIELVIGQTEVAAAPGDASSLWSAFPVRRVTIAARNAPRGALARVGRVVQTAWRCNSEVISRSDSLNLRRALEDLSPDIVFAQFGQTAARALPAIANLGAPFAVQFHGFDVTQRTRHWGYRLALRQVLKRAGAVFAPSDFLADRLRNVGVPEAPIHVVGPGFDESCFANRGVTSDRATPAGRDHRLRIVSVGRLTPVKGHMDAISAMAQLSCPAKLVIIGEGPERTRLEARVRELGLSEQVTLVGARTSPEIRDLMETSDIYLQLSRRATDGAEEALGLSPLEAAACGLPVVVSSSGGLGETCDDGATGFVVPPEDSTMAARRLTQLADSPDLRRSMGAAGARRAAAKFGSHVQARRASEVLQALLKDRLSKGAKN